MKSRILNTKSAPDSYFLIIGIVVIVFFFIGIVAIFFPWNILNGKTISDFTIQIDKYSDLGSFISGIIAPFFGTVTVILLAGTYFSQRQEISQQRESIKIQRFEDTFFKLLDNHQKIVEAMELRKFTDTSIVIAVKRKCFKKMYESLLDFNRSEGRTNSVEHVLVSYEYIQNLYKSELHHYFRFMYRIIKFVDEANINDDDKYEYTSIYRAMFSPYELVMLYYNGLHTYGKEKFKPLIERYSLLNNIEENLFEGVDYESRYKPQAFARSIER